MVLLTLFAERWRFCGLIALISIPRIICQEAIQEKGDRPILLDRPDRLFLAHEFFEIREFVYDLFLIIFAPFEIDNVVQLIDG
jgi:hypothetical protein